MKRKILLSVCVVIFTLLLTGCGSKAGKDVSSDISSVISDMEPSSQQNQNDSTQQDTSTAKISKEKAKEIALKHANVKESDITDYEIDMDTENGNLVYDISFEHKGKEYDYDVDAQTGEIKNSKNELVD